MAEKSDIPRASASLRSITPMVRITGGPGVDSAPMRAWTYIMLVPPGKEEHRAASYGSRCDHAVPQPEPILTQESTMGSRNTWTATPIRQQCHRRLQEALCRAILEGDGPPRPNDARSGCSFTPFGYSHAMPRTLSPFLAGDA